MWLTPVSQHLAPEEIAHVLADSGASVVFVDASLLPKLPPNFAGRVVALDSLDEALSGLAPRLLDPDALPGGTMVYTSGTSGRPKGVKRTRPATLAAALGAWRDGGRSFGFDGDGPHLVTGAGPVAGATITRPGHATDWGGYSGYFTDPDGFLWEVAHNPAFPHV